MEPYDSDANNADEAADRFFETQWAQIVREHAREQKSGRSALAKQTLSHPILTEVEQHIFVELYVEGAKAAATLSSGETFSEAQVEDLTCKMMLGNGAGHQLVASMFRLVLNIAKEQAAHRYGYENDREVVQGLVADANQALAESLTSYDARRCPNFALYASRVARRAIGNSMQHL